MPTDDDLFVNDDLKNSAENRLNHILFGLFVNRGFRESVLRELGTQEDSIFFKPGSRGWGRPDFAIESANGTLEAYIEVELDKNPAQLQRYRDHAGVRVFSFGRLSEDHDITLSRLVEVAREIARVDRDPQWGLMVRHFGKQVDESAGFRSSSTQARVELDNNLVWALREAGMVNWVDVTARPGGLYGSTIKKNGLSVRVYSTVALQRTISLFNISSGRPVVRFAHYDHLEKYLPNRTAALNNWANFLRDTLDCDIRNTGQRRYGYANLEVVEATVAELIERLKPLM